MTRPIARLICWIRGHRYEPMIEKRGAMSYSKTACVRCREPLPFSYVGMFMTAPTKPTNPEEAKAYLDKHANDPQPPMAFLVPSDVWDDTNPEE